MNFVIRNTWRKAAVAMAIGLVVLSVVLLASACEKGVDDIFRILGATPGTFINYGADGQVVFEAKCASMAFTRDTTYDVYNTEMKLVEPSSVIKVNCGTQQFSTVGFTSVYMSDGAAASLMADSQKFADLRIKNNNRSIPLVNFLWRDVKNLFVGTAQVVQLCDQNNKPVLAFAADGVTGYATEVAKSTMFKLDTSGNKPDGYVWISRGSYTALDTALLTST
jgi:hypothetical protein